MTPAGLAAAHVRRLGERIADARMDAGLRGYELAAAAGIDRATLSKIENGKAEPALRTVIALCAALSVSLSALVLGDDTPGYDCSIPGYYGPCTGACQIRPDLREHPAQKTGPPP